LPNKAKEGGRFLKIMVKYPQNNNRSTNVVLAANVGGMVSWGIDTDNLSK
jgi:hypothetical protein